MANTKALPFNKHEAEIEVMNRIAEAAHTSVENVRRLVNAEDSDVCAKLEDGLRISELNAKYGNKLCPTCGGSLS